jgi:hypothetical protein
LDYLLIGVCIKTGLENVDLSPFQFSTGLLTALECRDYFFIWRKEQTAHYKTSKFLNLRVSPLSCHPVHVQMPFTHLHIILLKLKFRKLRTTTKKRQCCSYYYFCDL